MPSLPTTISCSYCYTTFSKLEHLQRHERSHTGEKPFECDKCSKRFSRGDVLTRHLKGHDRPSKKRRRKDDRTPTPSSAGLDSPSCSHDGYAQDAPRNSANFENMASPNSDTGQLLVPSLGQPSSSQNHPESGLSAEASLPMDLDYLLHPVGAQSQPSISHLHGPSPNLRCSFASVPDELPLRQNSVSEHEFDPYLPLSGGLTEISATMISEDAWFDSFAVDGSSVYLDPNFYETRPAPDILATVSRAPEHEKRRTTSFGAEISKERFDKMESLWVKKGERPWQLIHTLWADVVDCLVDNIFSISAICPESESEREETTGSIDEARRLSLVNEFGVEASHAFPTADILEICVDVYFHRFYPLMPFIYRPTFSLARAPNMILYPMALIGLSLLHQKQSHRLVVAQVSYAMEQCKALLSRSWARRDSLSLLTTLASSVLLLGCAAGLEECVNSDITYALYSKAIMVAQENSLFELDKSTPAVFALPLGCDDLSWKAWARLESSKRVISCLVMIDAFFAFNLGTSPIIRVDTIKFYAPCSTKLFNASDAAQWSKLNSAQVVMAAPIISTLPHQSTLPAELSSSSLGLYTLMATVWLRLADVRHRMVLTNDAIPRTGRLIPGQIYQKDAHGMLLVPLIQDIYSSYAEHLRLSNSNHMIFWHNICISLTTDFDIFEIGAGRDGGEAALAALDDIAIWAETPAARRACLHAAQVYLCMSNKKPSDGISFLSEAALYAAALILGLYIFVSPASLQKPTTSGRPKPFELLDNVDWGTLGDCGLVENKTPGVPREDSAAEFIRNGCEISFAGVVQRGGFRSSRKVIWEYVGLLEEAGKWRVGEYSRILRAMSDSPSGPDVRVV